MKHTEHTVNTPEHKGWQHMCPEKSTPEGTPPPDTPDTNKLPISILGRLEGANFYKLQ